MLATTFRFAARNRVMSYRALSSLSSNPSIKVFDNPNSPFTHVLSYLETEPPSERLAIGVTATNPPTPQSFSENPEFLTILNEVVSKYGHEDDDLISQARAFASPGAFNLGAGGGVFFSAAKRPNKRSRRQVSGGAAAAAEPSVKEESAGTGRGGWVHLSDRRNPPDFGRIAWPEDILGSVEVDDTGTIIGKVQPSGTYRILTNAGILGLSPYLQGKLVDRLRQEEAKDRRGKD
ncbi:hypothetical protein G7Z17_g12073 [Cylindrodendrum hubeiense]|uniref:Uncharacterized protein n=1 Tax=Cylindrodendrum hubeiense TaxID=595255 RepID=A0A9P5H2R4_9HYPO|nr:hypothetical protein G7Z17_g12073 [Cylindrodendrum hubeiense]